MNNFLVCVFLVFLASWRAFKLNIATNGCTISEFNHSIRPFSVSNSSVSIDFFIVDESTMMIYMVSSSCSAPSVFPYSSDSILS